MKTSQVVYSIMLALCFHSSGVSVSLDAHQRGSNRSLSAARESLQMLPTGDFDGDPRPELDTAGIHEVISAGYRSRYQEWKDDFLSTELGRAQWQVYARNPKFTLTITLGGDNPNGAGTGDYQWDNSGNLIGATIFLGKHINQGFPSRVYYPVMNALKSFESDKRINGKILAATKIAHEFGHLNRTAATKEDLYRLRLRLVPIYNKILLSNGYNVKDPRLVELAQQMGGNPVELWEDREYWGEANAMLYLRDRFANDPIHCRLFNKIKELVDEYAKRYEERFVEIAKEQGVDYSCSWK